MFLETATLEIESMAQAMGLGGLIALVAGILLILVLIMAGVYVYLAFVWMTIAKKLKYEHLWLAWIPIANFFLLPILAKKHWAWGFFILIPPVYLVLSIFWLWLIYEQRNYPGEMSLVMIGFFIPFVGFLVFIANLIIMGFVAWNDIKKPEPVKKKSMKKFDKRNK